MKKPKWNLQDMEDNSDFSVMAREDEEDYVIAICTYKVDYPYSQHWDLNNPFDYTGAREMYVLMKYAPMDEEEERTGPPTTIKEFSVWEDAEKFADKLIAQERAAAKKSPGKEN